MKIFRKISLSYKNQSKRSAGIIKVDRWNLLLILAEHIPFRHPSIDMPIRPPTLFWTCDQIDEISKFLSTLLNISNILGSRA